MTYENIKKNYDKGLWDAKMIAVAVKKGVISESEYTTITSLSTDTLNLSLADAQARKLNELSTTCNEVITDGIDVQTTKGIEHFSLTYDDQINLQDLYLEITNGATEALYHSDDNICRKFTANEILAIATKAKEFKTYHTTYFNILKSYVKSLLVASEVLAITYGQALPDEYDTELISLIGVSSKTA